ncbi:MAG TPA: 2-isopropylmalate synthase [Victivallales bacterium]|nr:2-isopropylmalate synthase [Victivallales bacterium]
MKKIKVFDTTLRDGEQAAGSRLGTHAKVEIAKQLEKLNVDIIEAGFPISSPEDFNSVVEISKAVRKPVICGLTRAVPKDIDVCGEALRFAAKSRIHTGIAVSDVHVMHKFKDLRYGKTIEEKKKKILDMAVKAVLHSKKYTDDVEFYAEDAGRAERKYLFEVVHAVIDAGATVVNIPDTTGYTVPEQFGDLIYNIKTKVSNVENAVISVHCHNDLGMAVSNTLAAVINGAGQIEGTINGIGERAGNAALEEVIMALKIRAGYYNIDTDIDIKELYKSSRLVADKLSLTIPHNKAVIGKNAFAHSSGIHVDGFLKNRDTYEIINPEDIGFPKSSVVLTARTGRHGLRHRLNDLGYNFEDEELEQIYQRFLKVADKKSEVVDEDIVAIVSDEIKTVEEVVKLEYLHSISGTGTIPSATIEIMKDGKSIRGTAVGDGPVDAVYKAINCVVKDIIFELIDFELGAASGGTDAMATAAVKVKDDKITVTGNGASTDVVEASAKAYINGINKLYSYSR